MEINNAVDARRQGINTEPVLDRAAGEAKSNQSSAPESIEAAIADAKTTCKTLGDYSSECAAAWDAVEEMQAAQSDRHNMSKSAFEQYCQERPSADECRIYDV